MRQLTPRRFASLSQQKERSSTSARHSVSGSSTASTDTTVATTPTSSDDKKKRRKKKKSAAASSSTNNNNNNNADDERGTNHVPTMKMPPFRGATNNQDEEHESADPSQLPLGRRLEIAAAHGDIHAALVGLLGWSRLYVNTDTILEFFQSRALELLLENIFRVRPAADAIFYNLHALLANCLSVERDDAPSSSNHDVASVVVAAVRSVVRSSPSPLSSSRGATGQPEVVSVEKMAQYLSKLVVHYRLSLSGVDVGSELSQEIMRIDAELASAAARDAAVQGQAIRDTFQRRDIRCDALALYETRLAKIDKLVQESISSSTQHLQADKEQQQQEEQQQQGNQEPNERRNGTRASAGFVAFASADDGESLAAFDPKELEVIKQHMKELDERKAVEIVPLCAKREENGEALQELKKQRDALEAQLRALNGEIEDKLIAQQEIDEQITVVHEKFEDEAARFEDEHQHVIQHFQRKERRELIEATFAELQEAITTISLEHSDVQSLKEKRVVCMRQHLEGVLRYFASELPCVRFMLSRVEQSEAERKKYMGDAEGYKALGVSAVAKELLEKATSLQVHIEEDKKCLQALHARDVALLETIERLVNDPEHAEAVAALDPALTKEVQRHVDYVAKLHESMSDAVSNGHSEVRS